MEEGWPSYPACLCSLSFVGASSHLPLGLGLGRVHSHGCPKAESRAGPALILVIGLDGQRCLQKLSLLRFVLVPEGLVGFARPAHPGLVPPLLAPCAAGVASAVVLQSLMVYFPAQCPHISFGALHTDL